MLSCNTGPEVILSPGLSRTSKERLSLSLASLRGSCRVYGLDAPTAVAQGSFNDPEGLDCAVCNAAKAYDEARIVRARAGGVAPHGTQTLDEGLGAAMVDLGAVTVINPWWTSQKPQP
jgi:hypothetical protein